MTAQVASGSVSEIWRAARHTEQPHLLFYLVTKVWFSIIGGVHGHHWLARFPSVVWLALAAALVTVIGMKLFDGRVGLIAGAAVASHTIFLHAEQWARDFTLAVFLAAFATYAFLRMVEAPRSTRWAWIWAVSLLFAAWMEMFDICVLAGHAAAYVALTRANGRRPHQRLEVGLGTAAFALSLPNVVLIATANNGQLAWIPPVSLWRVFSYPYFWAGKNPFALIGCVLGVVVLAAAIFPVSRKVKALVLHDQALRVEPWKLALLIGWMAAPFVVTLVLSAFQPAYAVQYLLSGVPALAILLGVAIVYTPRTTGLALLAGTVIAAGLLVANYTALPPYAAFSFTP